MISSVQEKFIFVTTADGSPTLRFRLDNGASESEAMHSLKGALSETQYIYGTAMELALAQGFAPKILSLGLGIGYVEILAAAVICKHAQHHPDVLEQVYGESFELDADLRQYFLLWATRESHGEGLHSSGFSVEKREPLEANIDKKNSLKQPLPMEFFELYQQILFSTAKLLDIDPQEIKNTLRSWFENHQWKLREALSVETEFTQKFSCICYDAFSSKTSPELWTEEFLSQFFATVCEPGATLSTYACTGVLKRSLVNAGFTLRIREGFASKRDCTLALRLP